MRNLKKFLALVLAMMMAMSLMVTANAKNANVEYPDFDGVTEQFKEAVDVLAGMGVMTGDNGKFYADRGIMRSEMAAVLYRLMTGDTNKLKNELYADIAVARFNDVKADDWFAPYIGWCYDAGLMVGSNGYVRPWANVTGYETLVMVLRAMGYGKNHEYTGALWSINASSDGTLVGLLKDVKNTDYKNNLSANTRRDVVASIVFQAAQLPTVTWTPSLGYNKYIGVASAQGGNYLNPSLGWKNFGLDSIRSAIIGNEATAEIATRLGFGSSTSGGKQVYDDWGYPVIVKKADGSILKRSDGKDYTDAFDEDTKALKDEYEYLKTNTGDSAGTGKLSFTSYGDYDGFFDFETGLDEFAHEVTMWYDATSKDSKGIYHAYAMLDHVKSDEAFFADDNATVGYKSATELGVTGSKKAVLWSDRYSQIGTRNPTDTKNLSPISTYRKVVNPNGTVYIALSAEVAKVAQKNTTAKDGYLILGKSDVTNETKFTNVKGANQILLDNLTSDTKDEQTKVGALVTAYEVVGTAFALTDHTDLTAIPDEEPDEDADPATWIADVMYKLAPMETKTVTVKSLKTMADDKKIDSLAAPVTQVNTTAGDELKLSGITMGSRENEATSKIVSQALPVVIKTVDPDGAYNIALKAGTSYIAYTDMVGRFISLVPTDNYKFLYTTYADYVIGGLGTGTIGYNLVGVDWDAKIQGENTLKTLTVGANEDDEPIITGINDPAGDIVDIDGDSYDLIGSTKKDQGQAAGSGNQIKSGADTGYMFNSATGDVAAWEGLKMTEDFESNPGMWEITAKDAKNGFAKVEVATPNEAGDGNDTTEYLLTSKTRFIIVDGTGTATLKVRVANGLTELLDGATSANIVFDAGETDGKQNEVIFRTDATKYGTMYTDDNGVITDVILSEGNLILWNLQNLYFDYNQVTGGNGTYLPGTNPAEVQQFTLWQGKDSVDVFVDITLGDDGGTLGIYADAEAAKTPAVDKPLFFTLAKAYEKNGIDVYMAVKAKASGGETAGEGGLKGSGFAAQKGTYEYITVTNVHTGLFKVDGNDPTVLNMDDVTVVDVQFKTTDNAKAALGRNEITSVQELNNAVSVGKKDNGATYAINVAVVYDASNSSAITVYVLNVADA